MIRWFYFGGGVMMTLVLVEYGYPLTGALCFGIMTYIAIFGEYPEDHE